METLLEAIHFITGSLASPSELPPALRASAAGALLVNAACVVFLCALGRRGSQESAGRAEYDEAA